MVPSHVLELFNRLGVIIRNDHFIYTSEIDGTEMHGSTYVNKDGLYPHATETSQLCHELAKRSLYELGGRINCVVGPEKGGIILSQWVGYFLTEMTGHPVLSLFAEKAERILSNTHGILFPALYGTYFLFNRGYGDLVAGKDVLIVEDVIHTGQSVKKVADLVRQHGGNVCGVGSLCNRGGKQAQDFGVPRMLSLVDICLESWSVEHCPLCIKNIPINTQFGKWKERALRGSETIS